MKAPSFFIETEDATKMMLQYRFIIFLFFSPLLIVAMMISVLMIGLRFSCHFQDQAKRVSLLCAGPGFTENIKCPLSQNNGCYQCVPCRA